MVSTLPLSDACQRYGLRPPVSRTQICGLIGRLLEDNDVTSVWLSSTVTCEACTFWQMHCSRCSRIHNITQPRRACTLFYPRQDTLVVMVSRGELTL